MLYIIYFIGIPAFCACKKSRTVAGQDINDRGVRIWTALCKGPAL